MSKKIDRKVKGMDRREFLKKSAVVAGAAAISVTGWPIYTTPVWAGRRDHILIGRPRMKYARTMMPVNTPRPHSAR